MSDYRVFCMDGAGKICAAPESMEAESDDEALALIRAKNLSVRCELWDRTRLVARIPAHLATA
jgi:hypothetical protein